MLRSSSHPPAPEATEGAGSDAPPEYDLSYRDEFWASRAYEDMCDRNALRALLPGRGRLVDVGAGYGRLADEYGAFGSVTLVDASTTMTDAARVRVGADPRFEVVTAQADRIPLADASVDVIVAVRLLVHIADPNAVFAEFARLLRPGGCVILEIANRRHALALIRFLLRRQSWSPFARRPHEYIEAHFAHQPRTVEAQLRAAGLIPRSRRAVSLFRSGRLKRIISAHDLAMVEAPLQAPLGRFAPSPSLYIKAIRTGTTTIAAGNGRGPEPNARRTAPADLDRRG